jgi:hypothetical protein
MLIVSGGTVSTNVERCIKILGKYLGDAAPEENIFLQFLQRLLR